MAGPAIPQPPPSKPRPLAPDLTFAKRRAPRAAEATLPIEQTTATCPLCGSANQRSMRFCITCGQLLPAQDEGNARIGAVDLMRTINDAPTREARRPAAASPSIAPARVIDVGPEMPASVAPSAPAPPVAPQSSTPRAHLVLITRDGAEGPRYPVGSSTDLGRLEGQILFPDDHYISPRHARIVMRGGAFFVRDLESANGVFMRIPFTAASNAGQASAAGVLRERIATPRLPGGENSAPSAEQVLADQELFLVGQQVLRFEVVKPAEEAFGAASENGTLLFGTPAAPRYARLSQRTVEGLVRDVFHVRRSETVIGRESGDIVFTDDPFLSRRHTALRMHGGAAQKRRFTLADLGSSNGTFLRIREEVCLRHGDHVRIGQQLLRFDIDGAPTGL